MSIIKSFKYFVDENTKILVIGTMPGKESLEKKQYYANERNTFWKLISIVFNDNHSFLSYSDKLNCLKKYHVGLWDNLHYCERKGSLDSNIKNEFPNDFETLLKKYPKIEYLLFNGNSSHNFFKKYHPNLLEEYKYFVLPSTSPANATMVFEDKLKIWKTSLLQFSLD